MQKVKWILIVAVLAAAAIYGIQRLTRVLQYSQTDQTCATLSHRLVERLLREPNPEVADSRLQPMLREWNVLGPQGPIARNNDGWPIDTWGNVFRAGIVFDGGKRFAEVRSAGPDGLFDTDDDYFGREPF
jgi:hypothetical protein